ncbi:MAG: hypothetical protein HOM58_12290 [Rhodospirillaceae bacterium]|nr:hypothetical protein [Rhodospirillaceae bacterium]MBT5458204.1 hypothetical protein [Rhodospirillaceae bacterium]
MSSSIAALPSPTQPIPRKPEYDGAPDVPEIAFSELWQDKGKGFSFGDFLDIINPLQHIPVVSTIYRMVTEDEIGPGGSVEQHVAALWDDVTGDETRPLQVAAAAPARIAAAAQPAMALQDSDDPAYADDVSPPAQPAPAANPVIAAQVAAASPVAPIVSAPPPPQPLPRPPVTISPLAAVHRTQQAAPEQTATEQTMPDPAAERQRIAQSIEKARQAQAGLLLANVAAEKPEPSTKPDAKNAPAIAAAPEQSQPFRSHPYLLPRGAPPELVSRAMEQALARYQATLQQRTAPTPVAAPVPTPAPAR